ncbi:hypothetical protein [uncultured Marivita sp.]|uniref:hypothetical protein n=2 Tax=Marivita TaxID=659428 RepID=UPI0025FD06C0|nr:hypothetical protein [uncultured Marivita sp.]
MPDPVGDAELEVTGSAALWPLPPSRHLWRNRQGKEPDMSRKFIAAVLAVSTTIAAVSAVPARAASEEDIAKILAGAATIFIMGKAIQNSRDDDKKDKKKEVRHLAPDYRPKHHTNPNTYVHDRPIPKVIPRHDKPRNRDILPRACVRRVEGGHVRRVAMGRCLERNNIETRSLPKACRIKVETRHGVKRAYSLPCLRHRGYTLARY